MIEKRNYDMHYRWPVFTSEIKENVLEQLDTAVSIYDSSGVIKSFEDELSRYYNKKHALLVSSGTAALYSAFYSLGLYEKDEVICCAYGFFATCTPLFFFPGKIVLVDSNLFGNICFEEIEKAKNVNTRAIVITHMWGRVVEDYDKIVKLCKENNIVLIEDASHCHGGKMDDKPIGADADIVIMSLQGNKIITGGEGGVLLTNSDELFYKAVFLGHYNKRCIQQIPTTHHLYQFAQTGAGLKLRIHPVAARMAQTMFKHLDKIVCERNEFARYLDSGLKNNPLIEIMEVPSRFYHSRYAYTFLFKGSEKEKERFMELALKNRIYDIDIPGSTRSLTSFALFTNPEILSEKFKGKCEVFSSNNAKRVEKVLIKLPCWQEEHMYMAEFYVKTLNKITQEILITQEANV